MLISKDRERILDLLNEAVEEAMETIHSTLEHPMVLTIHTACRAVVESHVKPHQTRILGGSLNKTKLSRDLATALIAAHNRVFSIPYTKATERRVSQAMLRAVLKFDISLDKLRELDYQEKRVKVKKSNVAQ